MCFVSVFGDVFSSIGVREPQPVACKTFSRFGEAQNVSSKCCFVSAFGDVFSSIGVREPQPAASEAFSRFGEAHRSMERYAIKMLKTVKPVRFL